MKKEWASSSTFWIRSMACERHWQPSCRPRQSNPPDLMQAHRRTGTDNHWWMLFSNLYLLLPATPSAAKVNTAGPVMIRSCAATALIDVAAVAVNCVPSVAADVGHGEQLARRWCSAC